jgi:hypothetical protein
MIPMRLKLVRANGVHGYYLLPKKPNNPLKLSTVIIKAGPKEYYEAKDVVINYEPGIGWVLILPIIRDEIELLYLD